MEITTSLCIRLFVSIFIIMLIRFQVKTRLLPLQVTLSWFTTTLPATNNTSWLSTISLNGGRNYLVTACTINQNNCITLFDINDLLLGNEPNPSSQITYQVYLSGSLPIRYGDSCANIGNKLILYGTLNDNRLSF